MGRLVLIRHGEAEGNREHRFIGQTDVPLTPLGKAQASALGERFRHAVVDRVVASDLSRAYDTAVAVASATGMEVERVTALREINNGEWAGLTPQSISERWPDLWTRYRGGEDVQRPGGERWADVRARTIAALEPFLDEPGTTVVASHGGPILVAANWAAGIHVQGNVFRGPLGGVLNTAITVIDSGPRLTAFNDVGHLVAFAGHEEPDAPVE